MGQMADCLMGRGACFRVLSVRDPAANREAQLKIPECTSKVRDPEPTKHTPYQLLKY